MDQNNHLLRGIVKGPRSRVGFKWPHTIGAFDERRRFGKPFLHECAELPAQRFFLFSETIRYHQGQSEENPDGSQQRSANVGAGDSVGGD
ncbi:MAG: hypothetical protein WAL90_06875 [Desulfobacterales bacterium]